MKVTVKFLLFLSFGILMSSCVSKKTVAALQSEYDLANQQLGECGKNLNEHMARLAACKQKNLKLAGEIENLKTSLNLRKEQIEGLKEQIADIRNQRDRQVSHLDDLTSLSQSANQNIKETLSQLEKRDEYIHLLQAAKTRTDSINLALAVNLKSVLNQGISDNDVEIKVDKTVVFINLSDKMLFTSGSATITSRANEVLGKIAKIIESRPGLEVMVEGYTDNQPINSACIKDNWDLSVKRSTSVIRILQKNYNIDPNRLIAAGRGEYNALESNDTAAGRSINRRTRIIILPKLDQFYDLLNPNMMGK